MFSTSMVHVRPPLVMAWWKSSSHCMSVIYLIPLSQIGACFCASLSSSTTVYPQISSWASFFLIRCLLLQHFLHSKFICQIFRQHTSCFHRWPFSKCFPSVHSNQIQHNAENYHHCTTSEQTDSFTSRATFQKYVARDIHERYPNLHAPIARAIHYVARDVMYTKYQYYRM